MKRITDDLGPATLTIPQAAVLLGVGRSVAYEEVRRTDKLAGVRVIRVGRTVRVSKHMLERALRGELAADAESRAA